MRLDYKKRDDGSIEDKRRSKIEYNDDYTVAMLASTDLTKASGDPERVVADCNFTGSDPSANGYDPNGNLLVTRTTYGLDFHLWVRQSTYLSAPLRQAILGKGITLRYLP